jgi:hypothetical protein
MLDLASHGDHELGSQALGVSDERVVIADDDLRDAIAVTDINEDERSEISHSVDPAKKDDILVDVLGTEASTGVCTSEFA